jgi:pyruvate,water dikinase
VRSRADLARVGADEVVVVDVLPQDWATAMPKCRAVVTQTGGLLQFSARVLRHRGIPAVVGVVGVLAEIEDGDEVEVDGATGIVRIQLGPHRPSPRVA